MDSMLHGPALDAHRQSGGHAYLSGALSDVGLRITHSFIATDTTLNLVLRDLEIQNPMLSALTLEEVTPSVPSIAPFGVAVLGLTRRQTLHASNRP